MRTINFGNSLRLFLIKPFWLADGELEKRKQKRYAVDKWEFLESWLVLSEDCMNRRVEETATNPRDSLSTYFALIYILQTSACDYNRPHKLFCIKFEF
jgi:hypothetical protein